METFIEILKAIVFGIVEGITEWLPVSSTGHMIILGQYWGFKATQGADFYDFFLVIIQLGAILAVILSFFKELWPFGKSKSGEEKREIWITWGKILVASIPAGVFGILLDDYMDKYLYNYLVVSITLIVYGLAFLLIEFLLKRKSHKIQMRYHLNRSSATAYDEDEDHAADVYPLFNIRSVARISFQYAMIIGLAQCLALIPGTSRSGVTICAALLLSIDRKTSAKFSFYLSIPAMVGGSLIKGVMYGIKLAKGTADQSFDVTKLAIILVGMVVAFVVSLVVIKFFMKMLQTKTFNVFGAYRILLGFVLLILFFTVDKGQINNVAIVLPDYYGAISNEIPCLPKLATFHL